LEFPIENAGVLQGKGNDFPLFGATAYDISLSCRQLWEAGGLSFIWMGAVVMRATKVKSILFIAAAMAVVPSMSALAQVDNVGTIIANSNALASGTTLATFSYDPVHDRAFVASNFNANQSIRQIDNVGGVQTVQTNISEAAWLLFEKGGNGANGGGSPIPGGFLLNPQPITGLGIGAYQTLLVTDASTVVTTPAQAPNLTQRVYRYNLAQDANNDASDEMTSLMTLSQYQTAAGQPATNTTTNISRQFAWSGDGQSIYFIDSSTSSGFGGVYKLPAAGGAAVRLLNIGSIDSNTEPAVTTSGGIDSIYFRGGTITLNTGGIDKITHDGTNTTGRAVAVAAATISDFLELSAGTVTIASMAADADGNIYFNNTDSTSNRRGIYKYDTQGRLSKVLSYAERQAVFGGTPNSNTLRMQPRTISYTNGSATFDITQLLYAESSPINLISGANVFAVGDFDRNGVVDQVDIGLFKSKLTVKAGPALATADLRYDLNGNLICSFKDVKTLQQFYGFYDGDANIDKTVDTVDFNLLAANFGATGTAIWTQGDFDGNESVDTVDFNILASNFGLVAPAPAMGTLVPEPAGLIYAGLLGLIARRRKRST
jgi:hypothetical protein